MAVVLMKIARLMPAAFADADDVVRVAEAERGDVDEGIRPVHGGGQ